MTDVDFTVRTKSEAKAIGLKWFFTGVACKNGHVAERMVSNNACRECTNIRCKQWRANHLDYFKNWNQENKEHIRDYQTTRRRRKGVPEGNLHGQSTTRLYRIWDAMKRRSTRKHAKACYAGVSACPEWQTFNAFWAWSIQAGYKDSLVIDRIDSTGNYEPSNCRWTTYTENNRNRKNVKLTMEKVRDIRARYAAGGILQRELGDEYGVSAGCISHVCSGNGWREE